MQHIETRRRRHGMVILLLAMLVGALHALAYEYALYFTVSWFDTAMHVLGGLLIGSSIGWFISFEVPLSLRARVPRFFAILFGVFVVAVSWEVFEWLVGLTHFPGGWHDTISDILAGLVGACIAYGIYRK